MATVKRGNVPPTHPTVWVGLALAVLGLLFAVYAYTGARVYDITFAFLALVGALLALTGIMTAAWGRSIMTARASRARRAGISADAMAIGRAETARADRSSMSSEESPTVAAPSAKKRFSFSRPKREIKEAQASEAPIPAGMFAFRRREGVASEAPARAQPQAAPPEPQHVLSEAAPPLAEPAAPADPVRVTLRCPECSTTFSAEGVRPFQATCGSCGFSATV